MLAAPTSLSAGINIASSIAPKKLMSSARRLRAVMRGGALRPSAAMMRVGRVTPSGFCRSRKISCARCIWILDVRLLPSVSITSIRPRDRVTLDFGILTTIKLLAFIATALKVIDLLLIKRKFGPPRGA